MEDKFKSLAVAGLVLVSLCAGGWAQGALESRTVECKEAGSQVVERVSVASAQATMNAAIRKVYDLELTPPPVNVAPGPEFSRTNMNFAINAGMAMTPGGRLWAVWHAGEDGPKAHLVGTWSDDDGHSWHDTRLALCSPKPLFTCYAGVDWLGNALNIHKSCLIANIWMAPDGTLRLYAFVAINGFDGRGALYEYVCRNPDAEKPVWSDGKCIGWGGPHSKPLVLSDGTWVLPNDFESIMGRNFPELDALRGCGLLASSDGGATWSRRGFVKPAETDHYAEHMVVELQDRSLLMYMRTGLGLMASRSQDGGRTWTPPEKPASVRQIISRFAFLRLANGHLLLVKNGTTPLAEPDGDWWGKRRELTAFVSDDEGKTWKGGLVLDGRARVAYPDAFVAPDGYVYVSYDHDRTTGAAEVLFAKFTEADVMAGKLVSPKSRLGNVVFSSKCRETSEEECHTRTAKLQAQIDACAAAGGGRVTVPRGVHCVGQLYLRSNVELHLAEGAVLQGARGLHNYVLHRLPYSEGDWAAVVMALGVTNVAVTGKGEIFGDGAGFEAVRTQGLCWEGLRPRGLVFADSKGIRLEDFKLRDAACWGIVLKCCEDVVARRVRIDSNVNYNNDGFDVEARNVLIEDCDVDAGDDAYCVKSNNPDFIVENVTVRNCIARSHCNGFKIGTATHGVVRNVRFEHCRTEACRRVYRDLAPMPKDLTKVVIPKGAPWYLCGPGIGAICVECVDGGTVENIVADDIEVRGFVVPIFVRGGARSGRTCGTPPGTDYVLRNIVLSNIRGEAVGKMPSTVSGCAKCRPAAVRLENIDLVCRGEGDDDRAISEPGPEFDGCYPESLMFQRLRLPSYGLYVDRPDSTTLKNVRFTLKDGEKDARVPVFVHGHSQPPQDYNLGALKKTTYGWNAQSLTRNGKPWVPVMGEMHYSRVPKAEWHDYVRKMKAGGVDIVASYVFWNHHEPAYGEFDFTDSRDLGAFVRLCAEEGMLVCLRLGPWAHGEAREGGLPDWLFDAAKYGRIRTDDPKFLAAVERFWRALHAQVDGALVKQGGPIVAVQLENESPGPWPYFAALKALAKKVGFDVPYYTRTGWPKFDGEPVYGEILPLFGGYADGFWSRSDEMSPGAYREAFRFSATRTSTTIATDFFGTEQSDKDAAR